MPFVVVLAACGSASSSAQTTTTLVTQGLQAQLSGDLASAASAYEQAIKLDQTNAIALYDLGTVYDRQKNEALAVSEYRKALVISPAFADAMFNLAVDTAGSDPLGAEQLYQKVVAIQPNFAAAWLNLGFILEKQGTIPAAKADWAKAVALDASLAARIPRASASPAPTSGATSSPTPQP